jgi:8-oxo-dGTP pyrophosphatase MutT (NUDIX family)
MGIQKFITSLEQYSRIGVPEKKLSDTFMQLITQYGDLAFQNQNWGWHITASMLITNPEKTRVLLMFHKKLQKWLQFGGHSDGDSDTLATAIREFHEESGIEIEPAIIDDIFNIDIHDIPADLKWRPEHQHYDVLYLGSIPEDTPFSRQESEVDDIRWFDIDGIWEYVEEQRMLEMLEKIKTMSYD